MHATLRRKCLAVVIGSALAGLALPGFAADAGAVSITKPDTTHIVAGQELIGQDIRGAQNTTLGKIQDIVLDPGGVAHYLVIAPAADLNMGNKAVLVPWHAVSAAADGSLNIAVSRDQFTKAPVWSDAQRTAKSDWDTKVYDYYGLTYVPEKAKFAQLDLNRDNKLSRDEAQLNRRIGTRFKALDRDNNGNLSQSEFGAFESGASWPISQ